jgi:O-antigen ligase
VAAFGHPHETYLEILFEYGAVGLLIYLYLIARLVQTVLTAAKRHSRDFLFVSAAFAAVFMFLTNSFFEELWTGYNFIVTLFLFVGIGVSRRNEGDSQSRQEPAMTNALTPSL